MEADEPAGVASSGSSATLLAQYQIAVEMADRVSARRATANAFFATVETVFIGVLGGVLLPGQAVATGSWLKTAGLLISCLVGAFLSVTWFLLLKSYRELNGAKFRVINGLERRLPAQPFTDEWKDLKGEKESVQRFAGRYAELGVVERVVPIAFLVTYLATALLIIIYQLVR